MLKTVRIALPVSLTNLGQMAMGLIGLAAVGRIGAIEVGAVGIGASFYAWFMIFGLGLLAGLDFFISNAHGAGEPKEAFHSFIQGCWIAVFSSVPLTLMLWALSYHLDVFGINPEVVAHAGAFLRPLALSLLPVFLFAACRQYLQARGIVKPPFWILMGANLVNALGCYVLVFGRWCVPSLAAEGAGWSMFFARYTMLAAMILYLLFHDRRNSDFFRSMSLRADWIRLRKLLRLGLPAAFQMLFESGVFAFTTLLAGYLSAASLAAHQIVLNAVSTTFMVPLGIGSASAVLVGQSLGAKNKEEAVRYGWRSLILGSAFMVFASVLFIFFPEITLKIYTHDVEVISVATSLLLIGGIFELADGCQVVMTGALRGLGDTRTAMIVNFVGYWLVGLPVGALLCFKFAWGVQGLWIGLSVGLLFVAVTLLFRWVSAVAELRQSKVIEAVVASPEVASENS